MKDPAAVTDLTAVKDRLCGEVDRRSEQLIDISHRIHDHPELGFEERLAHEILADALAREGLQVDRRPADLETAFVARAGESGPLVAVLCEYDALPEIGHACGHNIIAAAGLGAGLAAAGLAEEMGGRLLVVGCPAEEGGGGKIDLLDGGVFEGVDAALMVHPAGADLDAMAVIAISQLRADFRGRAAHAAAAPERGRNALDAAVLAYTNVAALRQHLGPRERVHGIFTRAGDKPNIVPDHTTQEWYVRSTDLESLQALEDRVRACFEAGALAAGCEVGIERSGPTYAQMRDDPSLSRWYVANAARLGRSVGDGHGPGAVVGSTDMGNVSLAVPSIHPMIAVSPPDVAIHTVAFEEWAGSEAGDRAVLDGAKALAMTVADVWVHADQVADARPRAADRGVHGRPGSTTYPRPS